MLWERVKHVLLSALAVLLVLEEWLWELLTLAGRWLFGVLHLARFEFWLTQLPPVLALVAFLIPVMVVMPLNIVALMLLGKGRLLAAVGIEVVAKLLGVVLVARVFALTKRQLMTFGWFAAIYRGFTSALAWAHERLSATRAYRLAKDIKARMLQRKRPGAE